MSFYFQINFIDFCAHENCTADLQVSAKIGFWSKCTLLSVIHQDGGTIYVHVGSQEQRTKNWSLGVNNILKTWKEEHYAERATWSIQQSYKHTFKGDHLLKGYCEHYGFLRHNFNLFIDNSGISGFKCVLDYH